MSSNTIAIIGVGVLAFVLYKWSKRGTPADTTSGASDYLAKTESVLSYRCAEMDDHDACIKLGQLHNAHASTDPSPWQ